MAMTDEERRQMMRNNYYAQIAMLGYDSSGNPLDDVVRVVRCKDCKHGVDNAKHIDLACEWSYNNPDFYCAAGERKE